MRVCPILAAPKDATLSLRPFAVTQAKYAEYDPKSVRAILREDGSVGFSTEVDHGPTLAELLDHAKRYDDLPDKLVLLFACRVGQNQPYIGVGSAYEIGNARIVKNLQDPNPKKKVM